MSETSRVGRRLERDLLSADFSELAELEVVSDGASRIDGIESGSDDWIEFCAKVGGGSEVHN